MKEAALWKPLEGHKVECGLCSHRCKIVDGATGICTVRQNNGGRLIATSYGKVSSMGPDPIEKKPLYHFMPGTKAFSFGSIGCNFRCDYCQNWSISQDYSLRGLRQVEPEEVPLLAGKSGCQSVSWTYNEPAIWHEFTMDSSKLARTAGLAVTYVTNGYITEEALGDISPNLDAANIDVKGFTEEFYRKRCGARLQPVLDTCVLALELGIFIEVTYLIIPTQNDAPEEIKRFCEWVHDSLGPDLPVHFSRFHPDFHYREAPRTPMETMTMAYKTAKDAGLNFVYLGNIPHCDEENTYCPECGTLAIERAGFYVNKDMTSDGKCVRCGRDLNIVTGPV
jgi:pyruvate formate lyase activating enzyme